MPTLTITLPTWNRPDLLPHSLQSVLQQSFTDFELLLLDNGSEDPRVNEYCLDQASRDSRIKYSRNEINNYSDDPHFIFEGSGKYGCLFTDDDLMLPDNLLKKIQILESNPEIGLVYSNCQGIDVEGHPLANNAAHPPVSPSMSDIYYSGAVSMPSAIFRMDLAQGFEKILVDPYFKGLNDWAFFASLATQAKVAHIPEDLVQLREHPNRDTERNLKSGKLEAGYIQIYKFLKSYLTLDTNRCLVELLKVSLRKNPKWSLDEVLRVKELVDSI